ncbi:hypothetical protein QUA70_21225 [Microcoleus sp. LAD1_D5]|uniref:hypothetical protein n=1 Tax=unclassified Microcoleus TaxID=2642155 RepID=UPI002FD21193
MLFSAIANFTLTFWFEVDRLTDPADRAQHPIKFYHLMPLDLRQARHISTSALWIFTCCIELSQLSIKSSIVLGASLHKVKSVFWECDRPEPQSL